MKTIPILYATLLVKVIQEDRKTKTRRHLKITAN